MVYVKMVNYTVYEIKFLSHFQRFFLCVESFRPIVRIANNNQEKCTILHVPNVG